MQLTNPFDAHILIQLSEHEIGTSQKYNSTAAFEVHLDKYWTYWWQINKRSLTDVHKLACTAKSTQSDRSVLIQKNISRLQIAVNDSLAVQVLCGCEEVPAKIVHTLDWQSEILLKQALQVPSNAVFKNEPQVVVCLVPTINGRQLVQTCSDSSLGS